MEHWRYGKVFLIEMVNRDPFLIAAVDSSAVPRRIVEETGVGMQEAERAKVMKPNAEQVANYCKREGESLTMRVKHEGYEPFECKAVCREDALLQACTEWRADFIQLLHDVNTRYAIINRVRVGRE